jgi:hypothetical protein
MEKSMPKWRAGTYAIIAMKYSIYSKTYSTTSLRNIMQKHLRLRNKNFAKRKNINVS